MSSFGNLNESATNELALVAVLVAFCAVVVVGALWTAAWLRLDRFAQALSGNRTAIRTWGITACILGLSALAVLLGVVPATVLFKSLAGSAAVVSVMGALIATSASMCGSTKPASKAQTLAADRPSAASDDLGKRAA